MQFSVNFNCGRRFLPGALALSATGAMSLVLLLTPAAVLAEGESERGRLKPRKLIWNFMSNCLLPRPSMV